MSTTIRLISSFFLVLLASPSYAAEVTLTEKVDIASLPSVVWSTAKDFGNLPSWHPAFVSSTNSNGNHPGSVRVLDLGGPTITEELVRFNDQHRNFTYKINQVDPAVLPIENYVSWFAVRDNGKGGATVIWMGSFNTIGDAKADDVKAGVSGVYRAGLDNLKALLEPVTEALIEPTAE